jgi:drug/metabolite transporter (DMT)-like permease
MHTTAYFAMQCILFSPPLSVATGARYVIPTNPTFVAILPAVGIFGFTAQTLLTLGLQRETAGRGTLGMYIQLVFAVALEYLVFGILPRGLSVAGISIIIICALYIAVSNNRISALIRILTHYHLSVKQDQ